MPTFDGIRAKAEERFLANQPGMPSVYVPPPEYRCSYCYERFPSPEELRYHLGLQHPLELPVLYIHNEPLSREAVIRTPISEDGVELFQCTRCEVQIDGGPWNRLTTEALRTQLVKSRNSNWNLRLMNERLDDSSRAGEEYHIRFRIPDIDALDEIDHYFRQILVQDELSHSDLGQFEATLPPEAPAREYGGALGDYALGILLKERRVPLRADTLFEEFRSRMHSALDVLRLFNRPVAFAVSSSIRFNLNDFQDHGHVAAIELDTGLLFFRTIKNAATNSIETPTSFNPENAHRYAICPVDKVSGHLLSACISLTGDGGLSLAALESLQQLTRGDNSISEQDLSKIHVLCAEGYRRLERIADASIHLQAIQLDPSFGNWARGLLNADSGN